MKPLSIFFTALFGFLCALPQAAQAKDERILAIGDSLMAWHRSSQSSIADAVAQTLGEPVQNRSISGARIIYGLPLTGAMGMRIANQYRGEKVDWVILNGGGNDFMLGCGCGRCGRRMARMISPDARKGAVVDLVQRIRASGARVVVLGYLRSPGVGSPIESCKDEGDAYEARLAHLAARNKGVYFHSIAQLVPHGDRSFHGADMIHPSRKASAIIGRQIAKLIKEADSKR